MYSYLNVKTLSFCMAYVTNAPNWVLLIICSTQSTYGTIDHVLDLSLTCLRPSFHWTHCYWDISFLCACFWG